MSPFCPHSGPQDGRCYATTLVSIPPMAQGLWSHFAHIWAQHARGYVVFLLKCGPSGYLNPTVSKTPPKGCGNQIEWFCFVLGTLVLT